MPAQMPMPRARSGPRSVPLSRARLLGTTSAPPTPWTSRAAISVPTVGAAAQHSEATSMTARPTMRMRRRPKWSASAPASSNSAATVIRYPVSTHCSSLTLACRSRPIAGTATLIMYASRKPTIEARTVAAMSADTGRTAQREQVSWRRLCLR